MTVSCLSIGPCIMLNWCRPTVYQTHVSEGAFYNTSRSNKCSLLIKGYRTEKQNPSRLTTPWLSMLMFGLGIPEL